MTRMMKVLVYAGFSYSVDTTDSRAAAMNDTAQGAYGQVSAAVSFLDPVLLGIEDATAGHEIVCDGYGYNGTTTLRSGTFGL